MVVNYNLQNNIMTKVMERRFKLEAKNYGFTGRPFISGKVSKTYLKYLKSNPLAPLPDGKVYYKNKVVDRTSLIDKRSKTGQLKPSVRVWTDKRFQSLQSIISDRNIKVTTNNEMVSSEYVRDGLSIDFLGEPGRLAMIIGKLRSIASKTYNSESSNYILQLKGEKYVPGKDDAGNDQPIIEPFNFSINGKKLKMVVKHFEEYRENWVENYLLQSSAFNITIEIIELRVMSTSQSVGTTGGHYSTKVIDGIKIRDKKSKGKNNCFFWTIEDWLKQYYHCERLTPKLCNIVREEFGLQPNSKIGTQMCIEICKKLLNKNIYIINRYDGILKKDSFNEKNFDRVLFTMNEHIYQYEGEYASNYCPLCNKRYVHKHDKKNCMDRQIYLDPEKKRVLPNKRLGKGLSLQKNVLHYDIETHTDNPEHELVPYIVGYTHYDFLDNNWIYGTFAGDNCMELFYDYIRNCPKIKFLNAYNGNRFDAFFLTKIALHDSNNLKTDICVNNSSILKLTIPKLIEGVTDSKTGFISYPYLQTCDLNRHLNGSLKRNLEDNNCSVSKGEIDHDISTYWENTGEARKREVREYLKCDVLGLRELYEKFDSVAFKDNGVNLCDYLTGSALAYDLWKTKYLDNEIVEIPTPVDDIYYRKAIYGGRCYPNKKCFISENYQEIIEKKIKYDDIKDYLLDLDVTSLYPFCMTLQYPVGHSIKTKEYMEGKMGIYRCSYSTNKKLLIPPIPRRNSNGSLQWDLKDGEGHYTSIDIERAKTVGYKFNILDGVYWECTAPIYKSYMDTFYQKKLQAKKGTPAYQTAKDFLNVLYGKQIQRPIYTEQKIIRKRYQLLEIMIKNRITAIQELSNTDWLIKYEPIIPDDIDKKVTKPSHEGAFILAYSRSVMWKSFLESGGLYSQKNLFHYTDTDSMQIHVDACKTIPFGVKMGDMSNDLGDGCKIIKGIWVQPKLYMLEYIDKDMKIHHHYRGAGVPMKQLKKGVYEDLLTGKQKPFLPKFQIKKNLYLKKNRRYNNGIIENCDVKLFSLYHYNNTDVDRNGNLILKKILGTRCWSGRNFKSIYESYPKGYVS